MIQCIKSSYNEHPHLYFINNQLNCGYMLRRLQKSNLYLIFNSSKPTSHQLTINPLKSMQWRTLTFSNCYMMAKISKKEKDKMNKNADKQKIKEQLGSTDSIDLDGWKEKYHEVFETFSAGLDEFKVGRPDSSYFKNVKIRIKNKNVPVTELAQFAPKNPTTCVLNPYDSDQLEEIWKALSASDLGFQLAKVDKTLVITQPTNSLQEAKQKMIERAKKFTTSKKEKLTRLRGQIKDQLKKMKKLISQDRLKRIQTEVKNMHDKFNEKLDKGLKDKEREINQ